MSASANHIAIRPEWLATRHEAPFNPAQPVIDAHHHLYDRPGLSYLLPDYQADIATGHEVQASVFVQARSMQRSDGPPEYRPIGETEFANAVGALSASGDHGTSRVCAGIVAFADLTLGERVEGVLGRHIEAGGGLFEERGRLCGIRQTLCWDEDASLLNPFYPTTGEMMESDAFRAGFGQLGRFGLVFDAWSFFHQADRLVALARAFPDTSIVVDHCGGIVRIHSYANRPELYALWRAGIASLAQCPNVSIKLSGLGMRLGNFGFEHGARAPSSLELSEAWKPWVVHCLESFGAERCMWGSNFPVDKGSYSYDIGLNAMKRIVAGAGASNWECDAVFRRTAARVYGLRLEQGGRLDTPPHRNAGTGATGDPDERG